MKRKINQIVIKKKKKTPQLSLNLSVAVFLLPYKENLFTIIRRPPNSSRRLFHQSSSHIVRSATDLPSPELIFFNLSPSFLTFFYLAKPPI